MPDNPDDQQQTYSPPGNWRDPTSQSNDFWTNLGQAMGEMQRPQGASQQQALAAAGWTPQPKQAGSGSSVDLEQLAQLLQQRAGTQSLAQTNVAGLLGI